MLGVKILSKKLICRCRHISSVNINCSGIECEYIIRIRNEYYIFLKIKEVLKSFSCRKTAMILVST